MPRITMEMSSNETIKQAVMAGMGVSLLSLHTIGLELRHGLIATPEVEGLPVMRRWHVVNNLGKTLSPAAEAFRYFVLERGERFLAKHFPHELAPAAARGRALAGAAAAGAAAQDPEERAAAPRPRRRSARSAAAGSAAAVPGSRRRTRL